MKLGAFELLDALYAQRPRLEGADAGRDDHYLAMEARTRGRGHVEGAVLELLHVGHFFAEMKDRSKVMILLEEVFGELIGGADRNRRDVVDGLGRIKLHALAANGAQRINDVALDFKKAKLKNLEEADRTGADDDGIGFDHFIGRSGNGKKIFNSHNEWRGSRPKKRRAASQK